MAKLLITVDGLLNVKYSSPQSFIFYIERDQDGRVVKALDLSSNGRVVRVGSNPTFFDK